MGISEQIKPSTIIRFTWHVCYGSLLLLSRGTDKIQHTIVMLNDVIEPPCKEYNIFPKNDHGSYH